MGSDVVKFISVLFISSSFTETYGCVLNQVLEKKAIHGYYTVSGKSGSLAYTSTSMYISTKLLHVYCNCPSSFNRQ